MTATETTDDLWIRRYHPAKPGAPKLVVLPHAGGSATFYFPMARALSPDIEVLAIQYPGRQDRRTEPLLDSIDALADRLFPVLRPHAEAAPLSLFGHSMGATLSFELARRFEESGLALRALFPSARTAPARHRKGQTVHRGSDDELIAKMRSLSGTDQQVFEDEELMRLTLPAVRNDYKAAETYEYRPGTGLSCPVHAYIGDTDPMVTEDEARAWAGHTTGEFTLRTYPGGHFYLVQHQAAILKDIRERLARAS